MSLVEHARRELELIGEDQDVLDWMVSVVAKFAEIGHSGGSLDICVDRVTSLLRRENLSPLTDDPADWTDRSPESGYPIWQSVRNPKAFSSDGGKRYWLLVEGQDDDGVRPTYQTMAKAPTK
jgi:hypothetical protein